jgi:integrase
MSLEEVRAAIDAARQLDPAAALALRLASVAGLRRAEVAALQWNDIDGNQLTVDSSASIVRGDGEPVVEDAPTKTANARVIRLDAQTLAEVAHLRNEREQISPYMFSITAGPASPDRIGWWWKRARDLSGIDGRWRLHDLRH